MILSRSRRKQGGKVNKIMTQEEFKKNLESIVNEFGNFTKEYGIRMESVLNQLAHINEKPKPFGRWKSKPGSIAYGIFAPYGDGSNVPDGDVDLGIVWENKAIRDSWIDRRKIEV